MKWEDARDAWAKTKLGRDDVVINHVGFETAGGGSFSISDYTDEYEQADIYAVIDFSIINDPSGWHSHSRSFELQDFGALVQEIVAAASS